MAALMDSSSISETLTVLQLIDGPSALHAWRGTTKSKHLCLRLPPPLTITDKPNLANMRSLRSSSNTVNIRLGSCSLKGVAHPRPHKSSALFRHAATTTSFRIGVGVWGGMFGWARTQDLEAISNQQATNKPEPLLSAGYPPSQALRIVIQSSLGFFKLRQRRVSTEEPHSSPGRAEGPPPARSSRSSSRH